MRMQPLAVVGLIVGVLGIGLVTSALGCGKYGPPVRVFAPPQPVAIPAPEADEPDDESEPRPDQP